MKQPTKKQIQDAKDFIKLRLQAEISMQSHLEELLVQAAKEIIDISFKYDIQPAMFRFSANENLKRACAKGRSFETANTTVSGKPAANSLNLRTEAAHTPVSRLGKILRITFFPFSSFKEKEDKSVFTNSKSGATAPTFINSPITFTGCPLNFARALNSSFRGMRFV